jgi:biopolymer transport protein ExbD
VVVRWCLNALSVSDSVEELHKMTTTSQAKPFINVTPLIDVLLVLLIIFMVVTPLKQSRFIAKLPAEPDDRDLLPDIRTLVVTIQPDRSLLLNSLTDMGSVDDMGKLTAKLTRLFQERTQNHAYRYDLRLRTDLSDYERVQRTVFVKAPKTLSYGDVVKVIDGLKTAGADPVGLQLDGLH